MDVSLGTERLPGQAASPGRVWTLESTVCQKGQVRAKPPRLAKPEITLPTQQSCVCFGRGSRTSRKNGNDFFKGIHLYCLLTKRIEALSRIKCQQTSNVWASDPFGVKPRPPTVPVGLHLCFSSRTTGMTFDPQHGRRGGVQEREAPAPGTCANLAALTGVRTDVEVKAQIKTGLCLQ